jgi:hypothetical protein
MMTASAHVDIASFEVKISITQRADWQWSLCPSLPFTQECCKMSLIPRKSVKMIEFIGKEIINKNNKSN